jgi:hypothetical protein
MEGGATIANRRGGYRLGPRQGPRGGEVRRAGLSGSLERPSDPLRAGRMDAHFFSLKVLTAGGPGKP